MSKTMQDVDSFSGKPLVTPDKPAPGGQTDHTSPGIGQYLGDLIKKATGSAPVIDTLSKKSK